MGDPLFGKPERNFAPRTIWTGDNLDILRGINTETVDLIYLDPPFNSNRTAPIGSKAAVCEFLEREFGRMSRRTAREAADPRRARWRRRKQRPVQPAAGRRGADRVAAPQCSPGTRRTAPRR